LTDQTPRVAATASSNVAEAAAPWAFGAGARSGRRKKVIAQ